MSEQNTKFKSQNLPQHSGEWDFFAPLRAEIDSLFDQFNPFEEAERSLMARPFRQMRSGGQPMMDLTESDDSYTLSVDLPGVRQDDIEISLAGDMLTIRGHVQKESEETHKNVLLKERRQGSFHRSMALPPAADETAISAEMSDGVLTVTIPKSTQADRAEKKIEIKSR